MQLYTQCLSLDVGSVCQAGADAIRAVITKHVIIKDLRFLNQLVAGYWSLMFFLIEIVLR